MQLSNQIKDVSYVKYICILTYSFVLNLTKNIFFKIIDTLSYATWSKYLHFEN